MVGFLVVEEVGRLLFNQPINPAVALQLAVGITATTGPIRAMILRQITDVIAEVAIVSSLLFNQPINPAVALQLAVGIPATTTRAIIPAMILRQITDVIAEVAIVITAPPLLPVLFNPS
jgi:hypothetical protein